MKAMMCLWYALGICLLSAAGVALAASPPVTTVTVTSLSSSSQSHLPVTFGQPFAKGDVPAGSALVARLADGQRLPLQVDVKARHPDGSLRHAILTLRLPTIRDGERLHVSLFAMPTTAAPASVAKGGMPALPPGLSAQIKLAIGGTSYVADLRHVFESGHVKQWLDGPLVDAWIISGPLTDQSGSTDPHLQARFAVRAYDGGSRVRVSYVVENTFVFVPSPHNYVYDASLDLDGQTVYRIHDLHHYYGSRWRHVVWKGGWPAVIVNQNLAYLKRIGVVPNYDPALKASRSAIEDWIREFSKSNNKPMGISFVVNPMGQGGGRPDIGPLPAWTILYLLSGDPRMWGITLTVADLAGSWPVHFRDKKTNAPVSIATYPHLTWLRSRRYETETPFPRCTDGCKSPYEPDTSHEPSLAFIPYLLTGDYYYLEELQFWANYNVLDRNAKYRGLARGLLRAHQVRGQGWGLRTLGDTAYITPNDNELKKYFRGMLDANRNWYIHYYLGGKGDNPFGFLTVGYAFPYHHGRAISPWMNDFFTWSIGYLINLGYEKWRPFLHWNARFAVGRMTSTEKGYCWCLGSAYSMNVRANKNSPLYTDWASIYRATVSRKMQNAPCGSTKMAQLMGRHYRAGDMTGFPWSPQGYPSNMQPALAAAVNAGVPGATEAWRIFIDRTTKPDYSGYPNWDIVPSLH